MFHCHGKLPETARTGNGHKAGWAELQKRCFVSMRTLDGIKNPRLKVSALEMKLVYAQSAPARFPIGRGMGHSVEIRVPFVDVDPSPAASRPSLASKRSTLQGATWAATASPLITPGNASGRRKTGFPSSSSGVAGATKAGEQSLR